MQIFECLIEKIDGCKNNPENSPTTKMDEHIPSGFSKSTTSSFKIVENKHYVYRGKDCMKKFCESLRENTMEIINFKQKNMMLLTKERQKSYQNAKICHICKEKFEDKHDKDKNYQKIEDHCHYTGEYRGAAYSICNLNYSVPKEISIVFHNGSNYDYHYILKEFAEEFEGQPTCYEENSKKT